MKIKTSHREGKRLLIDLLTKYIVPNIELLTGFLISNNTVLVLFNLTDR